MEQEKLSERMKELAKAQTSGLPAQHIIKLLDNLREGPSPTEDVLRATKAGMIVGKLRANGDRDIARKAGEVVIKWKKSVEADKRARVGAQPRTQGSASPAGKPAASPAPVKLGGSKKAYEGDPETRKFQSDKVDVNRTGSQVRDNIIGLMYNGLAYRSREPEDNVLQRAIEVEAAAFKEYKGESKEYKEKARSLFQNLKNKQNRELGENVMSGSLIAEKFVKMTPKELMSSELRKKNAELEKENMNSAQVAQPERSISEDLQCSNCKQRKVAYTQAQTRSADEPMTTFCHCTVCDKHWKFS